MKTPIVIPIIVVTANPLTNPAPAFHNGIIAATVVAYFIERILLVVYTKWKLGIPVNQYVNLKLHIMYSIGLYACFGLSVYLYN